MEKIKTTEIVEIKEKPIIETENEKPEIKKPIEKKKGVFDSIKNMGGNSLTGSSVFYKSNENKKLQSMIMERDRYIKERNEIGNPNNDVKKRRKRFNLKKKADQLQEKIDALEKLKKDNNPIEDEEIKKYKNLSIAVNYKTVNLALMSREQFEIEKINILEKADTHFKQPAKFATDFVLKMSHITDSYPKIAGYSLDLKQSRDNVEEQMRKCLIHAGMQGFDTSTLFGGNPYLGLGIALSIPLVARYYHNKGMLAKNPSSGEQANLQPNQPTTNKKDVDNEIKITV